MSTDYTSFLPEVLPSATDCPQVVAINHIRNACQEFCRRTNFWQYLVPAADATLNVGDYTVAVPAGTQLASIMDAWYNGTRITAKTQEELQQLYRSTPWTGVTGTPLYFTSVDPTQVRLVPYPDKSITGAIVLMVSLMPTRASTTVFDEVYNRYAETVALGALARIQNLSGNSFYDPKMADLNKRKFNAAVMEAATKVNRGQTRAGTKIRFRSA